MRNLKLTFLLIVCLVGLAQCQEVDEINDKIYDKIEDIFRSKYPKDHDLAKCMTEYMRANKQVDRFYYPQLLVDNAKLEKELEPYTTNAELSCKDDGEPIDPKPGPTKKPTDPTHDTDPTGKVDGKSDDSGFFSTPGGIVTIVGICVAVLVIVAVVGKMFLTKSRGQRIPSSDSA